MDDFPGIHRGLAEFAYFVRIRGRVIFPIVL
jgi:hypothetical protein